MKTRAFKMIAVALLLAALPSIRWYVLRLQDGGGELAGLVPLVAAVWFALRDRKGLEITSRGVWIGAILLLLQAAAYPFLPAMIRALLMIAALAAVSGIWRKPGIVFLLVLALPWTASLDFFLGYPLRMLTSVNAAFLLKMAGTDVSRSGVQLLYEGRVVGVDAACSGMNMLWSTGLLTALLAAVFSLRWGKLVPLGAAALALALAGNSLRAAILFFPEAGLIDMPHLLHPGIGITIAGGCFLLLMKLARRISTHERRPAEPPRPSCPPESAAITTAALLVLIASCFSGNESQKSLPPPKLLTSFQGLPVTRIPLTPAEENFYRNFPGTIAVYQAEGFKLIVRQVGGATRKLHPASHCLRAEGFGIGEKAVAQDDEGASWLSYTAFRSSESFHVKERVLCPATKQSWPEISAWFWHALLHPAAGPWEAMCVITSADR